MTSDRWREVEEMVAAALDLPAGEQRSYIEHLCAGRPEVRREVEALLAACDESGSFLETPALTGAGPPSPRAGPYRLLEPIGHGGMGAVYRAERDDDQYRKVVAVKMIDGLMRTPALLSRFREERQILASLEHPNIARLLDGGLTAEGAPFIVMEYVEGVPIDEYCLRGNLSVRRRLELFRGVCSAVHYAHQNLVVHRDIKPANILVASDGTVKLLDFGVARILNAGPANGDGRTLMGGVPMTPEFASPEQVRGEAVSTASDVYSLGVLLYVLLTGRRPYDVKGKTLDTVLRTVCEEPPVRPRTPDTDLDAIILKALRKEPAGRYASAQEFSDDIDRYLRRLPVVARGGAFRYVAAKFAARHRVGLAVAALVALALASAVAAVVRESRIAERRFNDVRKLANSVIYELADGIAPLAGSTPVRKVLVTRALEYLDTLAGDAGDNPALELELAAAYARVGDVQGNPNLPNLGDRQGALASYGKARDILRSLALRRPGDDPAADQLALTHRALADVHNRLGNSQEATANAREALSLHEAITGRRPNDEEAWRGLAASCQTMANILERDHRPGARSYYEKEAEIYERLLARHPDADLDRRNAALAHKYLGSLLLDHPDLAGPHLRRAQELDEQRVASQPGNRQALLDLSFDLSQNGTFYQLRGELDKALESFTRTLSIRVQLSASDPKDKRLRDRVAYAHLLLGELKLVMNDAPGARIHFQNAARIGEELVASNLADPSDRYSLGRSYKGMGAAETFLAKRFPGGAAEHRRRACAEWRRALRYLPNREQRAAARPEEKEAAETSERGLAACGNY